jgi:hypothetical protein
MKLTALICVVVLGLCAAACSSILGDFNTGPSPDSGASNPPPPDASMTAITDGATGDSSVFDSGIDSAMSVTVSAAGVTTYVGQTATLIATASTTPTGGAVAYSWTVTSAPAQSTIKSSSLSGANTATVSFVPDAAGDYSFTLTATSGSASGMTTVTARAIAPTVLYMLGSLIDGGGPDASFTSAYVASGSDGKSAHAVTCPVTASTAAGGGFFSVSPTLSQFFPADDFTDFWEAPAGQASRFAVSIYDVDPSGAPMLFSGLEDASCASPPSEIWYDGGSYQPRFTADGSRLVFFGIADSNIVTVSPDGTDMRVVSAYAAGLVDSGLAYDTDPASLAVPPRPQWVDGRVAWVRQYTPSSAPAWEIVEADDVAGATPLRYMACPGGTPREFQFLADGTVIVAYRTTASSGPENLYRLAPDTSQNCTIVEQYTDLGNSQLSQATDFAVSPDQTRIAYVQYDGVADDSGYPSQGLPGGYGYVVNVDGGAPVRLSNDFLMYGPRWIGDGTRLVATRLDGITDAGLVPLATSIIINSPSPGPGVALVSADGYTTFASAGSNGGCSTAPGPVSPAAAFIGLIGAAFGLVFRRSRKRPV